MKKIIYILILISLTVSCREKKAREKVPAKATPKKLGDFLSDEKDFIWSAKQSDTSSYLVRLVFKKEYVVYQFHGQCFYYFFSNYFYTNTDRIGMLWSYKTDCTLNMDFLEQSNGIKKFPRFGDAFSEYELINDSLIHVRYNFPDWVNEINKKEKDSIFPNYLHLKNNEGIK